MPAAMAPEDTMTTSVPAFIRASIASASPASRPASNTPDGVVSALVPTLTTRLRAVRMASRCVLTTPLVGTVFAALTPGGLALVGADAFAAFQPRIGAPARHRNVDSPAGVCGSQSNVISPMVTAQPGCAPSRSSSSSTPRRARRSAR